MILRPEVVRTGWQISSGVPTQRHEIHGTFLPAYLSYVVPYCAVRGDAFDLVGSLHVGCFHSDITRVEYPGLPGQAVIEIYREN